ncbi:MAG: heterodisulfide reductase-related iron-sulfur binding cluster [Desulfovibrionaceae bacterium]
MLDQEHLRETEARCTQEVPPRCQDACPLRMDVRGFMAHIKDGKLTQARALLERHLPLPGILARICDHPCENVCLRRDLGGSLAVHALEQYCMEGTPPPHPLPRREKKGRVAVLGNGLAGLTAAFDLHRKGFSVTVFHQGQPWDTLIQRFPTLAADTARDELALLAREGMRFERASLDRTLYAQAAQEFSVLCVDADAAFEIALDRAEVNPITLCAADNVCHCGWLSTTPTGHSFASASTQSGEGRRAAVTLERLLTKVSLTAARPDSAETRLLHTPLDGITPLQRIVPALEVWSQEACAAEAARCLLCQCMACVRECVYLQKYRGYPRTYARQIHNNAAIVKGQHMANSLVNGCTLCGQCTEICPERFSMADLCLTARRDMVERGKMPPSAHEFALEDMTSATGENALFMSDPQDAPNSPPLWALMPGCQLWASRGDQVLALHGHVRTLLPKDAGLGLILSCCGIPARWSGREALFQDIMADFRTRWEGLGSPRLICACSSCLSLLRAELPQSDPVAVWEVLAAAPAAATQTLNHPVTLSIHDPCTARHNTAWQRAVRILAQRQGISVHEPRRSGAETPCCGYGGLVWNAQPELAKVISAQRAKDLPHTGLASCIMCRDRLAAQGKPCLHVLDILPCTAALAPDPARKGPGLSARRAARDALRRILYKEWLGQERPQEVSGGVYLAPDLLERLEARHILYQDVEEAVRGVESTGNCFEDQESGHSLGSWTPRNVTFWVEYSVTDAGYMVHDAWCHRMRVPGAGSLLGSEACAAERTIV